MTTRTGDGQFDAPCAICGTPQDGMTGVCQPCTMRGAVEFWASMGMKVPGVK